MSKAKKYTEAQTQLTEAPADAHRRIKREGRKRLAAFEMCRARHRDRLYATGEWTVGAARTEAWALAIGEYPPLPEGEWEEVKEKVAHWVAPDCDVEEELARLPRMCSAKAAYEWVASHPAMRRRGIGPFNRVCLQPDDVRDCPAQLAWNLLEDAVKDSQAFFKQYQQKFLSLKEATKAESPGEEESVADDTSDLDAILSRAQ